MNALRPSGGDLWKYYLGFALARLGTIVVLPIVAQMLGPTRYAGFEAAVSVMLGAMVVGDAGLGTAIVRFAGEGGRAPSTLVRVAAQLQIRVSLIAFLFGAIPIILLAPHDTPLSVVLLALLMFTIIEGLATIGTGVLRAEQRNGVYLALAGARLLTAAAAGAIGAAAGGTGGALFGVALAGAGFAVSAVRRAATAAASEDEGIERALLRYGVPLMLTSLMTWTLSLSDRIFMKALSSPLELAQYAASYRLAGVISIFVAAPLGLAWLPVARHSTAATRGATTARWSIALAWCALGSGALLLLASGTLVPLIFGAGFHARPGVVAAVVFSAWCSGLYILVATDVMLDEDTRRLAPVMLAVVLVNLALNAALIAAWGAPGAAIATAVSYAALVAGCALVVPRTSLEWMLDRRHVATVSGLLAALLAAWLLI